MACLWASCRANLMALSACSLRSLENVAAVGGDLICKVIWTWPFDYAWLPIVMILASDASYCVFDAPIIDGDSHPLSSGLGHRIFAVAK